MTANAEKLDQELRAAGIPMEGCSSTGRVDFKPEATEAQRLQAAAIVALHDPARTRVQLARDLAWGPLDVAALALVLADGAGAPAWAYQRLRSCADRARALL